MSSLRFDWIEAQQGRPVILARRMDVGRTGGGLIIPGRTWKTPAGEGVNYLFEGPSLQIRARLLPRGVRGGLFQVYPDPKGSRGVGKIKMLSEAKDAVLSLEADLYRRICEQEARSRQCAWSGVQANGMLDVDMLCEGDAPYIVLPEEGLGEIPEEGLLCDVVMGLHRVVVNHSRKTARPVWVLFAARKAVSKPRAPSSSSSDSDGPATAMEE